MEFFNKKLKPGRREPDEAALPENVDGEPSSISEFVRMCIKRGLSVGDLFKMESDMDLHDALQEGGEEAVEELLRKRGEIK